MNEKLIETNYDITKKSAIRKFYENNKILIFSSLFILIIFFGSIFFYLENEKSKRNIVSENYIDAIVYLENGKKDNAGRILKKIIYANDSTYSPLSLFLILNNELSDDKEELSKLFNHILEHCKFEKEIKNLIIFKQALFQSDFVNETELLTSLKPLINKESIWKHHALLLLADYYVSKNQKIKAKEFYMEILLTKNLSEEFYNRARTQLTLIKND